MLMMTANQYIDCLIDEIDYWQRGKKELAI